MKKIWIALTLLAILMAFCRHAFARGTGSIEGSVMIKQTNEALVGANVVVVGTSLGASTDENGKFSIAGLAAGDYQIQVTFIGYTIESKSASVIAGQASKLEFVLESRALESDELLVTAIRDRGESVVAKGVVTEEEIESSRHLGMTDVLEHIPGVHIIKAHVVGSGVASKAAGRFIIRGLGRNVGGDLNIRGIQVLTDGAPDFSQSHGHPFPDVHALDNIARIEVTKGPASVRYGNAMAGAVIMTTKTPSRGTSYYVKSNFGSFTTSQNVGRLGFGSEKGYAQFSGNYRSTDGHRGDNDSFAAYSGTVKFGYQLAPNLKVSGNVLAGYNEWENPPELVGRNKAGEMKWNMGDVNLNYSSGGNTAFLKFFRADGETRFLGATRDLNKLEENNLYGVKAKVDVGYGIQSKVTFGFDALQAEIINSTGTPGRDYYEYAPYGIVEHRFSSTVLAEAGVRYTKNEQFGGDISPEFGLVFKAAQKTILRGRAARGFRSPSYFEVGGSQGNADLNPAELWQYEVGINQTFAEKLTIDVVGFIQEGDNQIHREVNADGDLKYTNTGAFSHKGLEAALSLRAGKNMVINATTLNMDLGDDTAVIPHNTYTLGVAVTPGPFSLSLDVRAINELYAADMKQSPLDDYVLVDLQGSYRLGNGLRLSLAVNNLFDTEYFLLPNFLMPGIGVYGGISVSGN